VSICNPAEIEVCIDSKDSDVETVEENSVKHTVSYL